MKIDYVGFWKSETLESPFLMIVDKYAEVDNDLLDIFTNLEGHILDNLGLAQFKGELHIATIKFTKSYDGIVRSTYAIKEDIHYSGTKKNDHFEGTYESTAKSDSGVEYQSTGKFILEEFKSSITLDWLLKKEIIRKLNSLSKSLIESFTGYNINQLKERMPI